MSKRSIASFFSKASGSLSEEVSPSPITKKARLSSPTLEDPITKDSPNPQNADSPPSTHSSYPHSIPTLPDNLLTSLSTTEIPPSPAKQIIDKPDLNLLYYQPFFPAPLAKQLYLFLRASLPFYRVTYPIKRGSLETVINTPRFTTVFGVDAFSVFSDGDNLEDKKEEKVILDAKSGKKIGSERYKTCAVPPRPIPQCLEVLKNLVERETGEEFNFVLVNYYATSQDSISYHSDDEKFLGPNPTIASMSLGTTRDFLMKHKDDKNQQLKIPLVNGELVVMKGTTQKKWLHSIPKRANTITGTWSTGGRINITFRKGVELVCTGNYYRYNVGNGPVYRWNESKGKMEEYASSTKKSE